MSAATHQDPFIAIAADLVRILRVRDGSFTVDHRAIIELEARARSNLQSQRFASPATVSLQALPRREALAEVMYEAQCGEELRWSDLTQLQRVHFLAMADAALEFMASSPAPAPVLAVSAPVPARDWVASLPRELGITLDTSDYGDGMLRLVNRSRRYIYLTERKGTLTTVVAPLDGAHLFQDAAFLGMTGDMPEGQG